MERNENNRPQSSMQSLPPLQSKFVKEKSRQAEEGASAGGRKNDAQRAKRSRAAKSGKGWFFWIFILIAMFMSTGVGLAVGLLNRYINQMPDIPYLEDYKPSMPSRMFPGEQRNTLVADFFDEKQNRELATLAGMPTYLKQAVVSIEDIRFYEHCGISPRAFVRAAIYDIKTRSFEQGGSTITMQLAEDLIKNENLSINLPEMGIKSIRQKIWEILLALQIEKRYTKDEILEIYLNQVFLGGNIYGVARAAETYFGKAVDELTLKECALFAGMLQRPNSYAPQKTEAAERRTRIVLDKMKEYGFINEEERQQALNEPFQLASRSTKRAQTNLYPYFTEVVRRQFIEKQITDEQEYPINIYGQGVDILTTMDTDLQKIAEEALQRGIVEHEQRRRPLGGKFWGAAGYVRANVTSDGAMKLVPGEEYDARIVSEPDPQANSIEVTISNVPGGEGPFTVPIEPDETWLDEFDLFHAKNFLRVKSYTDEDGRIAFKLAKDNHVQGALVAVQPSTGKVLAVVGGYNFYQSQYVRATQADQIQPGSAVKPLLYLAALCDPQGQWTVASPLYDAEINYYKDWTPKNFEKGYMLWQPMKYCLYHSLNAASVWLLDNIRPGLRQSSIDYFRTFCRSKFNLTLKNSNLAIALGTEGTSPYDLAQAYAVLANEGKFMPLHTVEKVYQRRSDLDDRLQRIVYEFKPKYEPPRLTPEQAYLGTYLLRSVVEEGTATQAKELPFFTAGKTGTTDESTYGWFAGYSKDLVCIVYLGYDDFRRSLGVKMTGSKTALPVWLEFMQKAYEKRPELFGEIKPPEGIVFETCCKKSGKKATPSCPETDKYPFIKGTVPAGTCPTHGAGAVPNYQSDVNNFLMSTSF